MGAYEVLYQHAPGPAFGAQSGHAEVEIYGQTRVLEQSARQVVSALCVHAFRFSEDIQNHVLTLAPLLGAVLEQPR